jgi:hypothetical protein
MDPIFIILYAVIITILLTLVFPRFRQASPALRRFLWIAAIIGGIALLIVTYIAFMR